MNEVEDDKDKDDLRGGGGLWMIYKCVCMN